VAIFDPQRLARLPGGLRWSPIRGCETPRTALVRARGLAAGAGYTRGTVSDGDFWAGQTETALRCLLHAAALGHRRSLDLYRWALNPAAAEDAVTLLANHPDAAPGWSDALEAQIHADPRTRDSVWFGVRQALAALADPDVLAAVDPAPGQAFDPAAFLRDSGTLYLLATGTGSGACSAGVRVRRGHHGDRPHPGGPLTPGQARPAAAARPRRDRQPHPTAVPADPDG
jgi:hypothetical protein